jgi:O-antigen/teichoic acid export membrane protein
MFKLSRTTVLDYSKITTGVLGRLLIAAVYFLIIANGLTLAEFGIFAAASAIGLVLSRLLAFGFISPLYRVATARARLLGVYAAGLALWTLLSLPAVVAIAALIYIFGFASKLSPMLFAGILAAEILGWRILEFVTITLNGLGRFGAAARLVIIGSLMRTGAAVVFLLMGAGTFATWIGLYLVANALSMVIAIVWFAPRVRLKIRPRLYLARSRDAITAALSEMVFYVQSELDKLLVLGLAGDRTAGMYAIAMRLVDLTAIPVRSFNQMIVQKLMKEGRQASRIGGLGKNAVIETGIAIVSTAGLFAFIILLWLFPNALGRNVASIAPYLLPLLLVPALRNLIEYQAELLYAREIVVTRTLLLIGIAAIKLGLMAVLLGKLPAFSDFAPWLNVVFAALYLASAVVVYTALRRNAR